MGQRYDHDYENVANVDQRHLAVGQAMLEDPAVREVHVLVGGDDDCHACRPTLSGCCTTASR